MEFTSVFDDAGASAEEAQAERSLARAKVASAGVAEFLNLSKSTTEFGQRLALAEDRLTAVAVEHGVSVRSLVDTYAREFSLLMEAARGEAPSDEMSREAFLPLLAPLVRAVAPTVIKAVVPKLLSGGADEGDEETPDPESRLASCGARYANMKRALQEGVDPLTWIEQEGQGEGTAEKPVEAGIEAVNGTTAAGPRRLYSEHPSGYRAEWTGGARYHIYEGDSPVESPNIPGFSHAMVPSEVDALTSKFNQKKLDKHFHAWVGENGASYSDFNHPTDPPSYGDKHGRQGSRLPFSREASGLGMPSGGMADTGEAVVTPQVSEQASAPYGGGVHVSPNQLTTKPRQMPGSPGGSGNVGDGSGSFDPALNGSDMSVGGQDPQAESQQSPITAMVNQVLQENPHLSTQAAHEVAHRAAVGYGLVTEAEWSAMDFGHRPDVPDGPWTKKVKDWEPPDNDGAGPPATQMGQPAGIPGAIPGKVIRSVPGAGAPAAAPAAAAASEAAGVGAAAAEGASMMELLPLLAL